MIKTKQDRILNTFDEMFPDARCVLNHSNNLELLVAVMLSAQTTDEAVNKLTTHLFKKYQTVEDYANASLPELESDLHSIGLYRNSPPRPPHNPVSGRSPDRWRSGKL